MSKVHTPVMHPTNASEFAGSELASAVLNDRGLNESSLNESSLNESSLSESSLSESSLSESSLSDRTLAAVAHGIVTLDRQGQIELCNPKAQDWLAVTGQPEGCDFHQAFPLVDELKQLPLPDLMRRLQHERQGFTIQGQAVLHLPAGPTIAVDLSVTPLQMATGELAGAVVMLEDVTQSRQAIKALSWQASHDRLTGLTNRSEFESQLQSAIATATSQRQCHTLCYIDLDQFKIINDTCGHNAGDQLLGHLAQLFQREIRQTDILARIGGDEFGIILHHCDLAAARPIVERLHHQIAAFQFCADGHQFSIGASFGLVQIDHRSEGLAAVLSAADAACYAAKDAGRNRIHYYDPADDALARQRSERLWISQIHQAIAEQRFELYAQDIVPVQLQDTVGGAGFERHVEILLRMRDRDGQMVSPGCFIPAAERYGLMTDLDQVVIETFFRTYETACLTNSGRPIDTCLYAINLSARSLNDPQFIDFVRAQFAAYRVPPQVICFEITETAAISNLEQASQFIHELKQMGCHFALDDFGSGMNCFAYLKQLKIDYLKIDGSFIQHIAHEKIDQELVSCMNRIAHVLGVKTVAEWVENDEILQTLKDLEIDYAQGYGLHRPEPLVELLNAYG